MDLERRFKELMTESEFLHSQAMQIEKKKAEIAAKVQQLPEAKEFVKLQEDHRAAIEKYQESQRKMFEIADGDRSEVTKMFFTNYELAKKAAEVVFEEKLSKLKEEMLEEIRANTTDA